MGHSITTYI